MMEHVGIGHFGEYFSKIGELLTDDGYALIHSIGRMSPPGTTGPFIRKHIFPGVYTRSLSEVFAATEHAGLWVADVEVLRRHYDYTLQHWRDRFAANRAQAAAISGERFCRMWEYYLAAVQVGFRNGSNMVFQLLLSRQIDSVPITRDFMMVGARSSRTSGDPIWPRHPLTTCTRAQGAPYSLGSSSDERHQNRPYRDQTKRHPGSGEISAHRSSPSRSAKDDACALLVQ